MAAVKTYHVVAEREGHEWTASVTNAGEVHTWGRGLRHLEESVREAIALAEDLDDESAIGLEWTFITGDAAVDGESQRLRTRRQANHAEADDLAAETAALVSALRERGFSMRDAAKIAGISTARVGQLAASK